jgi:hypothetical protein
LLTAQATDENASEHQSVGDHRDSHCQWSFHVHLSHVQTAKQVTSDRLTVNAENGPGKTGKFGVKH